jgi:hypothetical protein
VCVREIIGLEYINNLKYTTINNILGIIDQLKYAYIYIPSGDIYVSRSSFEQMGNIEGLIIEEWEEIELPSREILGYITLDKVLF